jgi:hypothetical protein
VSKSSYDGCHLSDVAKVREIKTTKNKENQKKKKVCT